MFTHVVLFKLSEPTKQNVKYVSDILKGMKGNIPQIKEVEVGIDELKSERSFNICLITRFDSLEEMKAYQVHPYHVNEVLNKIKPYIEVSKVADYNI